MRKVFMTVTMEMVMTVDEGVEISGVMDNMLFVAQDNDAVATVEDFNMVNYEITDSK